MKRETKPFNKRQLQIVKIFEAKPYGNEGKTLLQIIAKDLSFAEDSALHNKDLKFCIFNPDLKDHILKYDIELLKAAGQAITVDYTEPQPQEGDEWAPDRGIVQIYDKEGQPIVKKKSGGGGGYGQSPETIRLKHELDLVLEGVKRVSIEGQAAINQVGAYINNVITVQAQGKSVDIKEEMALIVDKYWKAVEMMLDNFIASKEVIPARASSPDRPQKAPAAKPAEKPKNADNGIKNVGQLLTMAIALPNPVTRAEVCEVCEVNEPKEIKDLEKAWGTIQLYSKTKLV